MWENEPAKEGSIELKHARARLLRSAREARMSGYTVTTWMLEQEQWLLDCVPQRDLEAITTLVWEGGLLATCGARTPSRCVAIYTLWLIGTLCGSEGTVENALRPVLNENVLIAIGDIELVGVSCLQGSHILFVHIDRDRDLHLYLRMHNGRGRVFYTTPSLDLAPDLAGWHFGVEPCKSMRAARSQGDGHDDSKCPDPDRGNPRDLSHRRRQLPEDRRSGEQLGEDSLGSRDENPPPRGLDAVHREQGREARALLASPGRSLATCQVSVRVLVLGQLRLPPGSWLLRRPMEYNNLTGVTDGSHLSRTSVTLDDGNNRTKWLEFGVCDTFTDGVTGVTILRAFLSEGITNISHNLAIALQLPLVGLGLSHIRRNTTHLTAWVAADPENADNFYVPVLGEDILAGAETCTDEFCGRKHLVLPRYVAPKFHKDLWDAVRGRRVSISISPVGKKP